MPDTDAVRLAKRVAAELPCSRAQAEQYIEGGWVRVDGQVVDQPQARVHDGQQVTVDRGADLSQLGPATLLLHQPAGLAPEQALALVAADSRWPHDTSRVPLLRAHLRGQAALLALPPSAEGLAVWSQERRVLRRLGEEGDLVEQEWQVDVEGTPAPDVLQRLGQAAPLRASWQSERRLRVVFKTVDPARLPALLAGVGLRATRLRRIRLGRVAMAGLPAGQWRRLGPAERF